MAEPQLPSGRMHAFSAFRCVTSIRATPYAARRTGHSDYSLVDDVGSIHTLSIAVREFLERDLPVRVAGAAMRASMAD
jgi:hypothetical protein